MLPCVQRLAGEFAGLFGNVCVNAHERVDLLTKFRIRLETPYGVWAYRLKVKGILTQEHAYENGVDDARV